MRSSSVQGSFNAAEVNPTRTNTSLTTLQPAMQAVTGACRALLGGSAWKGRHNFWEMEKGMGWMIWKRGGFLCWGEWLQVQRCHVLWT